MSQLVDLWGFVLLQRHNVPRKLNLGRPLILCFVKRIRKSHMSTSLKCPLTFDSGKELALRFHIDGCPCLNPWAHSHMTNSWSNGFSSSKLRSSAPDLWRMVCDRVVFGTKSSVLDSIFREPLLSKG